MAWRRQGANPIRWAIGRLSPGKPRRSSVILQDNAAVPAFVDYYPAGNFYSYNGTRYQTEAAFWTAIGGVTSGAAEVIGPYDDPLAVNLVSNGGFASDTVGWTGFNSMAIASVGGELQMTPSGSLSAVSQALTGLISRGFKFTGTVRRGTSGNSVQNFTSINNNSGSSGIYGTAVSSTTPGTANIYCATGSNSTLWVGARSTSASGDGNTLIGDNFSLIEAWPAASWPRLAATFVLWGSTPAVASGNKVIYQEGSNSERERIRLVWGADQHLHWIVTVNNVANADFDLGVVAPSTSFRTALAIINNSVNATLNGIPSTLDQVCSKPGATHAWLKRSFTGETFDGTVDRWAILSSRVPDYYAQHLTAGAVSNAVWGEGDSYMAGANGFVLWSTLATAASRAVISSAVGGSTLDDILARVRAAPYLNPRTFVLWDGSSNGLVTVAGYLAQIDQIVQSLGHSRFLILPALTPSVSSPTSTTGSQNTADVYTGLVAAYGAAHVLNPLTTLNAIAASPGDDAWVTYGYIPPSLMSDTVHLNSAGISAIGTAIADKLAANGW